MNKKSILRKTFHFGAFTVLSRVLGFLRAVLQIKFLGVSPLSDAFIAAFKLPNFFRRIFAEGALSAAFIPSYVQLTKKKKTKTANGTMTLSFLFFEGLVFLLCLLVFLFPHIIIKMVTPGFSQEQIDYAIPLVKILFPFLFFVSSSALLSGALQSKNHFFAQSFGPVLHNIVYVATLLFCITYRKSPTTLATGILLAGVCVFVLHITIYLIYHFRFGAITPESKDEFIKIIKKFIPCLAGVGVVEINLFLDNLIASYLADGSYSLLHYANRFMNFPLGVFAVAFSTILLPHFSRITIFAPRRLHFYLLETAKFITWMIIPTMLFIFFTSKTLFTLLPIGAARVPEASAILICYSSGLIFFCFNKVLMNMFYSLHDTWSPTVASIIATVVNLICNIIGMHFFGAPGIAASTAISGVTLSIACMVFLRKKHKFKMYWGNFGIFLWRFIVQLLLAVLLFAAIHTAFVYLIAKTSWHSFFYLGWGYWLFTIPLFLSTMVFLFLSRKRCKTNVYFLSK